ncbi:Zinc-finger homeodomain protein 1 [Raphanus sativus]|uniref:Zinc-finger homeodomain protein 1-like n=1 Tax=Raphanus sativus TaxID=3726 RepID=A0A6J0JPM6_RAPSA|nr:zinc-finger homeodomain protein 1-like [Raphanus sativus]KAJ4887600.1 Zinc-finger homeodomain protein 1 [Raphanus sativus]
MDFEEEINLHKKEEEEALYDSPPLPPPSRVLKASTESPDTAGGYMVVHGGSSLGGGSRFRFRECLKNQAVNIGGHAVDGCGDFMPAGIEGTIEALKCAACGCHRNFHRKESLYFHQHHASPPPPPGFYSLPAPVSYRPPPSQAPPLQVALPQRERSEDRMETSSAEAGGFRKRFRTKFTAEQKERMLGLAERIGWRMQRRDDEVIQSFCQETGVPRQVLKVWLHNNKHTLGKSSSPPVVHHHQNPTLPPHESSSFHHEQDQP